MKKLTPHGPGFSFLDTCTMIENGRKARGSKWLDPSAPYFKDHFPDKPLMPGVLLIECAAQISGYLWSAIPKEAMKPLFLVQVDQFRFSRPVLPGETVIIETTLDKNFDTLAVFETILKVDETVVAQGRIIMGKMEK